MDGSAAAQGLVEFLLGTCGIAGTPVDHAAAANDHHVRDVGDVECALEFAVGVHEDLEVPALAAHEGLDTLGGARIVDGYADEPEGGVGTPVGQVVGDIVELGDAGHAPGGPEGDDQGRVPATGREVGEVDRAPVHVAQPHGGELLLRTRRKACQQR